MNRFLYPLIFLVSLPAFGQYQYQRLNYYNQMRIAPALYALDVNMHTSVKPLNTWKIDSLDRGINNWSENLQYGYKNWVWRKLFDEHLVDIDGRNYSILIDPLFNFQFGHEKGDSRIKYVNTRGFNIEGMLGEKVTFQSSFLENQARFPGYVNTYSNSHQVVPGQGYARDYKGEGFDFGMASGEITFTPDDLFSFTLGQGRNFFGEGYRSMLLSDATFNYPFFRIETTFGRVKYTNLWAQLYDVRPEASVGTNGAHAKKYLSSHYLSINVTTRWNVSFFEAIVVGDTAQQQGIDASFFNPVIFYRPVEFAVGSKQGNAMIGLASSYKIDDGLQAYGQFLLDEFNFESFTNGSRSWVNKYGWQLGLKYYNAFGLDGLFGRVEYNTARPYTYSHRQPLTNYGHYSQPLAHPWGANFGEGVTQVVYQYKRWEAEARFHYGILGLDTNGSSWGSDIYLSYNEREKDLGNSTTQGVRSIYTFVNLRLAWLINPLSNLKLEAGVQIRDLRNEYQTTPLPSGSSQYFYVGLRTGFFNNYYDF